MILFEKNTDVCDTNYIYEKYKQNISELIAYIEVYEHDLPAEIVAQIAELFQTMALFEMNKGTPESPQISIALECTAWEIIQSLNKHSVWLFARKIQSYKKIFRKYNDNGGKPISVTLTLGDDKSITLLGENNEVKEEQVIEIYDFLHDKDQHGKTLGMTLGFRDLYANKNRNMNGYYKHYYNYTISGQTYTDDDAEYRYWDDNSQATPANPTQPKPFASDNVTYAVKSSDISTGYVTLKFNDTSYLSSIVVSGVEDKTWWFDHRGLYYGSPTTSMSGVSYYISDRAANTYKIGRAIAEVTGNIGDAVNATEDKRAILSGQAVTPNNFGNMYIDTTNGSIKHYNNSPTFSAGATFYEISGGVTIRIPVVAGDTKITISHMSTNRNLGGYQNTSMRTWINEEFMPHFPVGLLNIITPAEKKSGRASRNISTKSTYDKLWLFAYPEIDANGRNNANLNQEGTVYPIFTDSNSRIKRYAGGSGSAGYWWLRSPAGDAKTFAAGFWYVSSSGGAATGTWPSAGSEYGVCLGFAI